MESGEIARLFRERAIVIANEEVEHAAAHLSTKGLGELIRKGRDAGMLDSDAIELFEGVDWSQGFSVGLENAEPTRAIGRVRGLVNASVDFLLDNLADLIVEASRDGNVPLDPRDVRDSGHNNWREEVFAEATSFAIRPRERTLEVHHKRVQKLEFLGE